MARLWRDGVLRRSEMKLTLTAADSVNTASSHLSRLARCDVVKQMGQTGLRPSGPPRISRSLLLVDVVSSLSDTVRAHSITRLLPSQANLIRMTLATCRLPIGEC